MATIRATATEGLSRFDLDLRGLHVSSVRVDGEAAGFRRRGQELIITPRHRLPLGERFKVRVQYQGKPRPVIDPDGSKDGWIPTSDGAFVADEPQGAPTWFPCNDHPTDKATYDFRVTVPRGITAVANGELERRMRHRRRTTFVWSEDAPMATYLATVTTGRFRVSRSRAAGIPSYVAVDPSQSSAASPVLSKIPAILRLLPRPVRRLSVRRRPVRSSTSPPPSATRSRRRRGRCSTPPPTRDARARAVAPVVRRRRDPPAVARHLAQRGLCDVVGVVLEPARRRDEHAARVQRLYATSAQNAGFWNPPPGDPGGPANLFDGTIYERGGMTLEALREKVGGATFFRILRDWLTQHRYGNASTQQFIELASADSGRDLAPFLRAWLFRPIHRGKPPRP